MFYRIFLNTSILLKSLTVYTDYTYGNGSVARPTPRIGEEILIDKKLYTVVRVIHDLDSDDIIINVNSSQQ